VFLEIYHIHHVNRIRVTETKEEGQKKEERKMKDWERLKRERNDTGK